MQELDSSLILGQERMALLKNSLRACGPSLLLCLPRCIKIW